MSNSLRWFSFGYRASDNYCILSELLMVKNMFWFEGLKFSFCINCRIKRLCFDLTLSFWFLLVCIIGLPSYYLLSMFLIHLSFWNFGALSSQALFSCNLVSLRSMRWFYSFCDVDFLQNNWSVNLWTVLFILFSKDASLSILLVFYNQMFWMRICLWTRSIVGLA